MAVEKRLGQIQILGKEYPLNFSLRIAQRYNELAKETRPEDFGVDHRTLELLHLLMEDAAAYNRVVLGKESEILSLEALELIFTPADTPKVAAAIKEALELGGMRMVTAKSSKKTRERVKPGGGGIPCLAFGLAGHPEFTS